MGLSKSQQITPKCCKKVQKKQTVFLAYSGYDLKEYDKIFYGPEEEENVKPADRKKMYERYKPVWVTGYWDLEFNCWGTVKIKFCPHCSRPLPEIKRRKTTRKIRSFTDGGSYCDTCDERGIACDCYRPEYAWEPVKEKI